MSRDIAAGLITVDRSPSPNYLRATLENLKASDLLTSERLAGLAVTDSGPGCGFAREVVRQLGLTDAVFVAGPPEDKKVCANLNVATALLASGNLDTEWVMFLEDDIDVCGRFFDSVGAWLDDHAQPDRHVYSLGANYPHVQWALDRGEMYWDYPICDYYGTQGFVLRNKDAHSLAEFLIADPYLMNQTGTAWDLMMHKWAISRWPDINHFMATCPAFVQHIGKSSIVAPRNNVHYFPSFPGPDWSYFDGIPSTKKGGVL